MRRVLWPAVLILLAFAAPASAYVGPGVGAGTLAVVLGVLASVVLWLFAVLWYPFKRTLRRRRATPAADAPGPGNRAPR